MKAKAKALFVAGLAAGLDPEQVGHTVGIRPRAARRLAANPRIKKLVEAAQSARKGVSASGVDLRARVLVRRGDPRITAIQQTFPGGFSSPDEEYFAAARVVALMDAEEELARHQ